MPESRKRKLTPEQIIAGARRPEKTVKICLRGDIAEQIEQLDQQLGELSASRTEDRRLGDPAVSAEELALAEQIHALEVEADEYSIDFTVRALPKDEWRSAKAANPANDADSELGWAVDRDNLATAVLEESVVSPELATDVLGPMARELAEGQWVRLRDTILAVNGGDGSLPFSQRASLALRLSGSEAGSPEDTDSPSASSTGGNPARSRRASTTTTDA